MVFIEQRKAASVGGSKYGGFVRHVVGFLNRFGRHSVRVGGAVAMALELLIAGIVDKYAAEPGPKQRTYGAGVAESRSVRMSDRPAGVKASA